MSTDELAEKYQKTISTIKLYPQQFSQAWEEIKNIELPENYSDIENVAYCGMGGSALGARIVNSVMFEKARIPVEIYNGYKLPYYAKSKTLVIVSSYSGTTEETLANVEEAVNIGTKVFGITTGGKLGEYLKNHNIPVYIFNPQYNPSLQPRMSLGYAVGSILGLFSKLQIITLNEDEVKSALQVMQTVIKDNDENVDESKNLAKQLAKKLKNRIPILVASEHLYGSVYSIKNQFNESAKTFSALYELPELNHHLMEGLKNPAKLQQLITFFFFNSTLYSDRVKKRYPITVDVVEKNHVETLNYLPNAASKLSQAMEVLTFGSFVVYYLAKDYQIDPSVIPWVDYFKAQLGK
jgi:glucose/mannose-6-phosphate isomerase